MCPVQSGEMSQRVLLINADDFGVYPAGAMVGLLDRGLAGSCSLMVPAPAKPCKF